MKKRYLILMIILLLPIISSTTCPKGLVNDYYPGDCGIYTDANSNQICDYSETTINPKTLNTENSNIQVSKMQYNITLITILSMALYLGSYFLSKKGKISLVTHRKIWNFFLLITFIVTAITSIIIVLGLEYQMFIQTPFNLNYLHIEFGYVMILISIFHILWHIPYFKSYLKIKK